MTQVIFFRSYQYSQNFISKYLIGMWDHLDFRLREFSIIKDGSSIKKVITYLHLMLLLLLRLPSSCNSSIDFKKFHNSRREINLLKIEDQDHFTTHTYYVLYKVFDMDGIDFKVLGSTMSSIFESSLFPPRSYCDANTLGIYFVQNLSNPYWTLCTRMQPSLMRKTYISYIFFSKFLLSDSWVLF